MFPVVECTPCSGRLTSTPQPLCHNFTFSTLSIFVCLQLSGVFCVSHSLSDSQLLCRSERGRSTRSLEYGTASIEVLRHILNFIARTSVAKQLGVWEETESRCTISCIWLFFYEFLLYSFPPSPSCFILQLISPLEVMLSPRCPQRAQGSLLSIANEQCVCVRKWVYMCIMTWTHLYPDLRYSIIKKKETKVDALIKATAGECE